VTEAVSRPGVGDPDRRAHLEDERDFLLASLRDLDEELAAGDIDEDDHRRLADDYTARAAEVLRALEAEDRSGAAAASRPGRAGAGAGADPGARRTTWRWAVAVVAVAALAGLLVAQAAGDRGTGELSGDIRASSGQLLADAREAFGAGDAEAALAAYDEVLAIAPTNLEALTYKAWVGRTSGLLEDAEALELLDDALAVSPTYPDAQVFRAVVLEATGRPREAAEQLWVVDAGEVPPFMAELVSAFGLRLVEALVTGGDVEGANRTLDTILAVAPEDLTALVTKGTLLAAVAEASEGEDRDQVASGAFDALDRAVEVAEDQPEDLVAALLARAEVRARLGDPEGARADLARIDGLGVPDPLTARTDALRAALA
jgi:tetratricopeptide (TPR) repeat protein